MSLPDYLESTAKDYARQLTAATSAPIDTSKFVGRQFVAVRIHYKHRRLILQHKVLVVFNHF